jgi:hypothetical protein
VVDIATVSVVSSALLAGLTIGANLLAGERQRRHEADLDFEARVWDRKSEALFEVMNQYRLLIGAGNVTELNRTTYALDLSKLLDAWRRSHPLGAATS